MSVIAIILIIGGTFFLGTGTLVLLRFPDFYCRAHATGKSDTLGLFLMLTGVVIYNGISLISLKIWLIALFIMLANPTATHAICRAAFLSGLKPWE